MKKSLLIIIITLLVAACTGNRRGDGNCRIIEDKGGERIKEDDFVSLTYQVKRDDQSVLYSTYRYNMYREKADFKGDLFDALGRLGEGDSAIVKISIDSLVKHEKINRSGKIRGAYLTYLIRINKVISRIGQPSRESDSLLNASIENYKASETARDKTLQRSVLQGYLASNGNSFVLSPTGVYYDIIRSGRGPKPQPGDICKIWFTARHTNGEVIATNDATAAKQEGIYSSAKLYEPLNLLLGRQLFIKGVEDGLYLLTKGSKARLLIPSGLSNTTRYGYLPIICDVEVLDISRPDSAQLNHMLHGDHEEIAKNN